MTDYWMKKPETLDDFAGNALVKAQMQKFFDNGTLPHVLMLIGESGYGKGCLTNIIRQKLGVTDINLSFVDCGVFSTVGETRKLATKLAQTPFGGESMKTLFVLDEVHRITKSSQEALLASCENMKPWAYIVATTNQPYELLDSFRSRFMEIKLSPLNEDEMLNELFLPVVRANDIKVRKSTLQEIYKRCEGNNRKALSMLQSISEVPYEKHKEALGEFEKDEATAPLYKAINILFNYNITDWYSAYVNCMKVFEGSRMDAEGIRIVLVKECSKHMCNPKSRDEVERVGFFLPYLIDGDCYGAEGWGKLGNMLYQYLSNFSQKNVRIGLTM